MFKLNKDILFLLFEELQEDSKTLFPCLLVNRLWCETIIPILWRNPWRYDISYCKKSSLYYIITFYLSDDIKEFLNKQGIKLPLHQTLLFDYLSFCRSMNINVVNNIITAGSPSAYNQFLFQQEVYKLLIRKCPEFKYLDIRSIEHQIFYFPEAKIRFNTICELKCDKSIESSYFYGLAYTCQNIQRLIIINTNTKANHGIVKLVEVQKNLKYFEWDDNFDDDYFTDDPYKEIFLTLSEKSETLNHLIINFQYVEYDYGYYYTFLQNLFSKLVKLKTLKFNPLYLNGYDFEAQLKFLFYNDLEIFKIDEIECGAVTCVIENSGGRLREILNSYDNFSDAFYEDSLTLIQKIYMKCPFIERLSIEFPPSKKHFYEFETLLKNCQKLKVLLLSILDFDVRSDEKRFLDGEELLKILIRAAPTNLREIRFYDHFKFSLETLEEFLEKWRGKQKISVVTCDTIYNQDKYLRLINKYKNDGVIKDFITSNEIYL